MLFKIDWPTNICIFPDLAIFPIDDGPELLLHFDAVFNTVYSGSAYSHILKARILTPTIPQKNLNFPQICPKKPQNGQKLPKMVQSGPNMTPNGQK